METSRWLANLYRALTQFSIGLFLLVSSPVAQAQTFLYVSETGAGGNTDGSVLSVTAGGSTSTLATGLDGSDLIFLTMNGGTLYQGSAGDGGLNSAVNQISSSGTVTPYFTFVGNHDLAGLVFDSSGNLFVCDCISSEIDKITPGGASESQFTSGSIGNDEDVTYYNGFLYEADYAGGKIYKIFPTGVHSVFATVPSNLVGIVSDGAGNFYATNGSNTVYKINSSGTVSVFAHPFGNSYQLDIDSSGNLYVVDNGNDSIDEITPGGVVSVFVSGLDNPTGIAIVDVVPEPSTWALLMAGAGMIALAFRSRKRV